jgi:hypothetical protein
MIALTIIPLKNPSSFVVDDIPAKPTLKLHLISGSGFSPLHG